MKMVKNQKDYYHLVICISIIASVTMVLFFLNSYVNNKMMVLKANIEQDTALLDEYESFIFNNKSIENYKNTILVKEQMLNDKMPENLNNDVFLVQLNQLAKTSGVEIVSLVIGEEKKADTYRFESFVLQIRGDFFATVKFLQLINKEKRLICIAKGELFQQNSLINTKLTLQIYANN